MTDTQHETGDHWKDIPGYVGIYQASRDGKIKSFATRGRRPINGQLLSPGLTRGYATATLFRDGSKRYFLWHRLIAMAFLGEPDSPGLCVNHKDGNRLNNHIDNLEWVTQSENQLHSFRELGRIPTHGINHGNSKATPRIVRRMRRLRSEGLTYSELARMFGMARYAIECICTRKTWKHVV